MIPDYAELRAGIRRQRKGCRTWGAITAAWLAGSLWMLAVTEHQLTFGLWLVNAVAASHMLWKWVWLGRELRSQERAVDRLERHDAEHGAPAGEEA